MKPKYFYVTYFTAPDKQVGFGIGSTYIVIENFKYFSIYKVQKYISNQYVDGRQVIIQSWASINKEQYDEGVNCEAT